jgi:hypothetical protein
MPGAIPVGKAAIARARPGSLVVVRIDEFGFSGNDVKRHERSVAWSSLPGIAPSR